MMLKFYAYFKQSTDGKCSGKRPGFWDIVGRAKYDAWKRLGEMPREKAMEEYVNELKKIVETMSYTDNVADFYGSINELENVNIDDLALVAPEALNRQKSDPNSPLHSRNNSRLNSRDGSPTRTPRNSHTDTSDEEYIDTVDVRYLYFHFRSHSNIYVNFFLGHLSHSKRNIPKELEKSKRAYAVRVKGDRYWHSHLNLK